MISYVNLQPVLTTSLNTYMLGVPAPHVRVVNDGSGAFFVCAWQLSLAHMHTLEGQRVQPGVAGGTATSRGAGSSAAHARQAPSATHDGLRETLARAQAALSAHP